MKKIYFFTIGMALLFSCAKDEVTPTVTCFPTSVTLSGEGNIEFTFGDDGNGGQHVTEIAIDAGTDSSSVFTYVYDGVNIATITQVDGDGSRFVYNATYDGNKLTSLYVYFPGTTTIGQEVRFIYSGDNVTRMEMWFAPPSTGTLFQVLDYAFEYSNGDLIKSTLRVDIEAFFAIAFDTEPGGYNPVVYNITEYAYDAESPANPLKGTYFLEMPDFSFMQRLPGSLTIKDADGNVAVTETFTITKDENGNATQAVSASGNMNLEATYVCN